MFSFDYQAQIISGNAQSMFTVSGLTLLTGSRKLDNETRRHHELDVRIIDTLLLHHATTGANRTTTTTSTPAALRYATCKLHITVQDMNDNRPVVNDIELAVYEKVERLLLVGDERVTGDGVPIANAIAIDQDHINKLSYSIVGVRLLSGTSRRKPLNSNSNSSSSSQLLAKSFRMNATNGNLYVVGDESESTSSGVEMPCEAPCTIQVFSFNLILYDKQMSKINNPSD